MNKTWHIVITGAAILLLLFLLSSVGKKVPVIPADSLHANIRTNETCLLCHSPGMRAPLKSTHPPKEQCVICHTQAK